MNLTELAELADDAVRLEAAVTAAYHEASTDQTADGRPLPECLRLAIKLRWRLLFHRGMADTDACTVRP